MTDPFFLTKIVSNNLLKVKKERFSKLILQLKSQPKDISKFSELVINGMFFESLIGVEGIKTRDQVKENILKIINDRGKSNYEERERVRRAFKLKYPTIFELIEVIKSGNYKNMSTVLMSMEAQEFLIWFPQHFYYEEKNSNIPLFTIHDCFLTTESKIDYLESWIKNYFEEKGMLFKLKRE